MGLGAALQPRRRVSLEQFFWIQNFLAGWKSLGSGILAAVVIATVASRDRDRAHDRLIGRDIGTMPHLDTCVGILRRSKARRIRLCVGCCRPLCRQPSGIWGGPSFPTRSANRRACRWADHGYGVKISSS